MKIDMGEMPREVYDGGVQLGNVYPVQGGSGGPRFRVVVGMSEPRNGFETRYAVCLIVNRDGDIVSADKVADFYLDRKCRVGVCDLTALSEMRVQWL